MHSSIGANKVPQVIRRVQEKTLIMDWLNHTVYHIAENRGFEEAFPNNRNPEDPQLT